MYYDIRETPQKCLDCAKDFCPGAVPVGLRIASFYLFSLPDEQIAFWTDDKGQIGGIASFDTGIVADNYINPIGE